MWIEINQNEVKFRAYIRFNQFGSDYVRDGRQFNQELRREFRLDSKGNNNLISKAMKSLPSLAGNAFTTLYSCIEMITPSIITHQPAGFVSSHQRVCICMCVLCFMFYLDILIPV